MRILSFTRTTAALVARRKSVTRREWNDKYFDSFLAAFETAIGSGQRGLLVQAWSASPHRGGKKVGEVLITGLTKEPTREIPDSDWEAEGFAYMEEHGLMLEKELSCAALWAQWRNDSELLTAVIRFEVACLEPGVTPEQFLPGWEG